LVLEFKKLDGRLPILNPRKLQRLDPSGPKREAKHDGWRA